MNSGSGNKTGDDAVSPVVGEMLVLTMVLILAAVFSSSLSGFIPEDRPQSVDLAIYGDYSFADERNVTIWHKGGDPVHITDIRVIFSGGPGKVFSDTGYGKNMTVNGDDNKKAFLPGDRLEVDPGINVSGCSVRISTSNAVIFTGKVK